MSEKKKNLLVRIVSALVLLPLVLAVLWAGGTPLATLVAVASALVAYELHCMAGFGPRHPASAAAMALAGSLAFFAQDLAARWPGVLCVAALAPIASFSLSTLRPVGGDLRRSADLAAWATVSVFYAGLLASLVALRSLPGQQGFTWTIVALATTWGNDTGAYFSGLLFGKRKLYPLISPNKTWEGFFGGMAVSILAVWIVGRFDPSLTLADVLLVGGVAGILGPLGDLSESMVKRAFGVKDSGRIIPGHGGIFDRIDALLFIAPWILAYVTFFRG